MRKYYIIKGNDEGEAIEPYLINSEDNDLDHHLSCNGDCSREYTPISAAEALFFIRDNTEAKVDTSNRYHIAPGKKKGITDTWRVLRVKNGVSPLRASKIFKKKADAFKYCRMAAKRNGIKVIYIHRTNGLIELKLKIEKKK